jgi:hypothetical protein
MHARDEVNGRYVLEQHVKPLGPKVQRHAVAIVGKAPTPVTTHKSMKDDRGRMKPAKVVTTVAVTINGSIWAYRPKLR